VSISRKDNLCCLCSRETLVIQVWQVWLEIMGKQWVSHLSICSPQPTGPCGWMNIFWCCDFRVNVVSREKWDQSGQEVGQWVYFLLHHIMSYKEMCHFYNILSFSPGWERSKRSRWACRLARCEGELSGSTIYFNLILYNYKIHI